MSHSQGMAQRYTVHANRAESSNDSSSHMMVIHDLKQLTQWLCTIKPTTDFRIDLCLSC